MRLQVKEVAKLMEVSEWFIRRGLQQGVFSWGYAVKTSTKYTYWISPVKFSQETGILIDGDEDIELTNYESR